jgi:hypothetical protein
MLGVAKARGVRKQKQRAKRYSIFLLYWQKVTNSDAKEARPKSSNSTTRPSSRTTRHTLLRLHSPQVLYQYKKYLLIGTKVQILTRRMYGNATLMARQLDPHLDPHLAPPAAPLLPLHMQQHTRPPQQVLY